MFGRKPRVHNPRCVPALPLPCQRSKTTRKVLGLLEPGRPRTIQQIRQIETMRWTILRVYDAGVNIEWTWPERLQAWATQQNQHRGLQREGEEAIPVAAHKVAILLHGNYMEHRDRQGMRLGGTRPDSRSFFPFPSLLLAAS